MHTRVYKKGSGKSSGDQELIDRDTAIKRVNEFINELLSLQLSIRKAILFGSYVTNRQREWSDIDLALVADEFSGFGFEDRKYFARINIRKPYAMIQTKTYAPDYFEKGDPFIDEIKKSGIIIFPS
jgi:hypothetical protein